MRGRVRCKPTREAATGGASGVVLEYGWASPQTASDGSFYDSYSVCSTACPGSTGETDALQYWTVNGYPLPHVDSVVYKCTSITIDGY
jgi:hypothetical protein